MLLKMDNFSILYDEEILDGYYSDDSFLQLRELQELSFDNSLKRQVSTAEHSYEIEDEHDGRILLNTNHLLFDDSRKYLENNRRNFKHNSNTQIENKSMNRFCR